MTPHLLLSLVLRLWALVLLIPAVVRLPLTWSETHPVEVAWDGTYLDVTWHRALVQFGLLAVVALACLLAATGIAAILVPPDPGGVRRLRAWIEAGAAFAGALVLLPTLQYILAEVLFPWEGGEDWGQLPTTPDLLLPFVMLGLALALLALPRLARRALAGGPAAPEDAA